ncbi:MAG: hydrogenase expression/formation protein HypE [Anaerolineaceae bacterium]|nr:hydrogenase expression/formation protein HypE [Anaerolineaceae bacterium]
MEYPEMQGPVCPMPLKHDQKIVMGHGSGGKMSQDLIQQVFQSEFTSTALLAGNDFAYLAPPPSQNVRMVTSVDAHIVSPLFFPGGDIGKLSICGTVNDVAVSGAIPQYITAAFILEEGFEIDTLQKIVHSMKLTAEEAGVEIVSGDTKVVEKGKADGVFITTTGIGYVPEGILIHGANAQPGDKIIISGNIGDHGIAVLAARGDLGFQTNVESDTAPLNHMIKELLLAAPNVHVLRDPTRGGLATTLNEIAVQSNVGMLIDENTVPIQQAVRAASEMLGFDPLYIANEGKLIVIVPEQEAQAALKAIQTNQYGQNATIIGEVTTKNPKRVLLQTYIGGTRILDVMSGEMLPRIC